jgi:hypothetical protein
MKRLPVLLLLSASLLLFGLYLTMPAPEFVVTFHGKPVSTPISASLGSSSWFFWWPNWTVAEVAEALMILALLAVFPLKKVAEVPKPLSDRSRLACALAAALGTVAFFSVAALAILYDSYWNGWALRPTAFLWVSGALPIVAGVGLVCASLAVRRLKLGSSTLFVVGCVFLWECALLVFLPSNLILSQLLLPGYPPDLWPYGGGVMVFGFPALFNGWSNLVVSGFVLGRAWLSSHSR